jgi:hypothetical protein
VIKKREQPLAELNKEAWRALVKELGVVKAIRFIGQFDMGSGNYATDRDEWQKELTVEGIVADIERRRRSERKRKRTIPSARKKPSKNRQA